MSSSSLELPILKLKEEGVDEIKIEKHRELTDTEKKFVMDVPQQVYEFLNQQANAYAIERIEKYLAQNPGAHKKTFFEALKTEIKVSGVAFAGTDRLRYMLSQSKNKEIFKKSSPFGYSNAAKCMFDLFRIYILYPVLDQKILDEVVVQDPHFKGMLKHSHSHFQYFQKNESRSFEMIKRYSQYIAHKKILESKESNLQEIVETAQKATYWQPNLFANQSNIGAKQLILQQQLVFACEVGDLKQVKKLLSQKMPAKIDLADPSGKFPLAAAVWGMNSQIIVCLLEHAQAKNENIMTWEACETHNTSRYGRVFLLPDDLSSATEEFLNDIEISPFLRSLFLTHINSSSAWEKWREASTSRRYKGEATIGRVGKGVSIPRSFIEACAQFKELIQEKVESVTPGVSLRL